MAEKLTYAGRRTNGAQVVQLFIDDSGKELLFKGIRGVILGCSYAYEGDRKISARPDRVGDDVKQEPAWEAKDALAEDFLEAERARQRIKKFTNTAYRDVVARIKILVKDLSLRERSSLINKIFNDVGV